MSDVEPESRKLRVTTWAGDGCVELSIEDQGVGFDDEQARRMFDPLYTTRPEGIGIGLAINRTILAAHDGRMWATSNPDRGATFRVRLPISREDQP